MAQLEKLLEPGYIKNLKIKNRVSMAPMEKQYGDRVGNVTQRYIDYMEERAKNGVGMITVESTFIDPVGRGNIYQIGLWDDSNIPSHKRMTDKLHKYGTIAATELHHAGRNASTYKTGFQPVAPSPVPCEVSGGYMPRELTVDEIKEVIKKYAEAARRAKEAGYDMITLHGAHGYMLNSFLSPYSNKRTDEYGGSIENRWRFGIEVYQATRAAVGDDYPVGYRITADEFVEGGLTLDDTKAFAKKLEDLGLDYIDVSVGIYESAQMIIQPMDIPLGCLLPYSAGMKEVLDIPVIGTGRINDMVFAEKILERNEADFVHMVRAFHADPEILVKAHKGDMDDICMCMACNKCIDLMFTDQRVCCTVNPAANRERAMALRLAKEKKRIMVIGGGLAGMEVARVAALRGHDVTLFEKDNELGGSVRWASKGKYREEWWQTARYRIHAVNTSGVKVSVGKEITLDDVKTAGPDVVVVATGTVPFVPPYIPGVNKPVVTDYVAVLLGERAVGKKAVVIGGKDIGLATAEFLSENGCKAIIVEDSDALGGDLGGIKQMVVLPRIEEDTNIDVKLNSNVEEIGDDWVEIQSKGEREKIEGIDMVVFAAGREMVRQLDDDINREGTTPEVYIIGDAAWPREPIDVIYEAAVTGRRI
ncbi:MAG: FAD-dependent oxidoreductase [Deltaproteobacteria bacterium]|nr:FAD-dependent oxidoreductase [Deltaproteobacteria bacterium]